MQGAKLITLRSSCNVGQKEISMKRYLTIVLCAAIVGCASTSQITPIGRDTFMMSKQAASGFGGLGNMKSEVIGEAAKFCSQRSQELQLVGSKESQGPYVYGNFPRVEINFLCVTRTDSDHRRIQPATPTQVIEIRTPDPVK
jgi:hypothetical protein